MRNDNIFLMKHEERQERKVRPLRRRILRLAAVVTVLCVVLAVWRVTSDFPSSWERRISKSLSSDGMAVEVGNLSFSLAQMRLRVGSLALYSPGEARRQALSVSNADCRLRPKSLSPNINWLSEVRVESIDFDADALSSLSGESSGEDGLPEFGPVGIFVQHTTGLGLMIQDLSGRLSSAQGTIAIDDLSASFHGRGEHEQTLRGRICVDPAAPSVEAYGKGDLDFSKLVPTLRELDCDDIAEEFEKFDFPILPPHVETVLSWAPTSETRSLSVSIQSGSMLYCGVRLSGLSGVVRVGGGESWSRVDIDPLEVRRNEGSASGNLSIDIDADILTFDAVSMINPVSLAAMLRLLDDASLPDITFETPKVSGSGSIDLGQGPESRTAMRFSVSADAATVHGVRFSQISISGGMKGDVLDIPRISAEVIGGSINGSLRIGEDGKDVGKSASASLALCNAQLSQVIELVGNGGDDKPAGTVNATASYNGPLAELDGGVPLRGRGTFSADFSDALLFRIPLFAGLTDVLTKYIPGANFLVDQDEAHICATLEEGRWNISDFAISGVAFSIDGSGTAAADGTDLNIVARLRLLNSKTWLGRCLRFLLSPLSGLLGVRATGSISSPEWASAPFSRSSAK